MNGQRMMIFSGGELGEWALDYLSPDDVIIGVDRGAFFLIENQVTPTIAIGDFDSVTAQQRQFIEQKSGKIWACDPVMKDLTDTEMAFHWALEQNPQEIILFGVLGSRFDHSLANIHLLLKGLQKQVRCRIIGKHNEVTLIDHMTEVQKDRYTHVSLLPLSMSVTGITLEGFQYPLTDATLQIGDSLGISNVLLGEKGKIQIKTGYLLVIQSRD
ncbi:thiamine diphosphokinase [Ammoniphilus resinae]|uniref:Thiamine diphosphokinase n=1 Tax=Ammoniphilus resinae TaxID=861532 RepID=A0ABS4GUL4_9BACL|nr:thiamine diphosphokinase [Ammoniphilus resinae]MBP1933959.1 thiamine pyrophosphokinase [Ammoniphilus resinae]